MPTDIGKPGCSSKVSAGRHPGPTAPPPGTGAPWPAGGPGPAQAPAAAVWGRPAAAPAGAAHSWASASAPEQYPRSHTDLQPGQRTQGFQCMYVNAVLSETTHNKACVCVCMGV